MLPPDPLLSPIWHTLTHCPDAASDTLRTIAAEAVALANGRTQDPAAGLAIVASWCAYQSLQTRSQDLVSDWLDELTEAAIVAAGDALVERLPGDVTTLLPR